MSYEIPPEQAKNGVVCFLEYCAWSERPPTRRLYERWRTNEAHLTRGASTLSVLNRLYGSFEAAVEVARPSYEAEQAWGHPYIGKAFGADPKRITDLVPK